MQCTEAPALSHPPIISAVISSVMKSDSVQVVLSIVMPLFSRQCLAYDYGYLYLCLHQLRRHGVIDILDNATILDTCNSLINNE